MAAEILSTLEQQTRYASGVPLPSGVSRSSLGSDRSADFEDAQHARNSSLDALQGVSYASGVPLPHRDSRSSSRSNGSAEHDDARYTRHSSLDALERVPLVLNNTISIAPAPLTSVLAPTLHDSPPGDTAGYEQSSNIEPNVSNDLDEVVLPSFSEKVRTLQSCLPHLQNIRYPSRRRDAKIDCYDFSNGLAISTWHAGFRLLLDGFFVDDGTPLSKLLEEQPQSGVDLRLIVAEDLSSDLIEQLGSLLDISPEPFEEHLLDSGWSNGVKIDQGADSWITRGMNKEYLTIKWYRPVKRQLLKPNTYEERVKLLDPHLRRPWFTWAESVIDGFGKRRTVRHSSRPLSNIFRNEWDIHSDIIESKDPRKTVAWEEQTTIWSQKRDSYQIVLLLLDPLPIVSDEASGVESALRSLGLHQPFEDLAATPEAGGSREISLPGMAASLQATAAGRTPRNVFIRKSTRVVRPRRGRSVPEYVFDLLQRITGQHLDQWQQEGPIDSENAPGNPPHESGHATLQTPPQRSPSRLSGSFGQADQSVTDESRGISDDSEDSSLQIYTLTPLERSIFRGLLPRGPMLNYGSMMSFHNVVNLEQHLDTETSTAVDLAAWIRAHTSRQRNSSAHSGPLDFLFAIVQKDTLNTLQLMDEALTQIGRDILDDSLIQQRLMKWRLLLGRFDAELRSLERSLSKFAVFIAPLKSSSNDNDEVDTTPSSSPLVADLLREGKIEIANLRHRATSSYQSLMANMSIVESKRGIAEAEGVTKLTELAFFFIPLTFSASIFSMQVKELNAADISVSAFIILALIITVLSYGLRLLIRSESFIKRRHSWTQDIRSDAALSPDTSIPTTTFLLWLWRRLGFLTIVVVLVLTLIICPIAALWTRNINRGFKAIITILLLIITLYASYGMIAALLYVDRRGLHFRRNIFKTRSKVIHREPIRFPAISLTWIKSSWVLGVVVASAVAAGPLAAIWTRPLEPGIKAGATAAIGILYIGVLVFLLLRAMYDGAFNPQHERDE